MAILKLFIKRLVFITFVTKHTTNPDRIAINIVLDIATQMLQVRIPRGHFFFSIVSGPLLLPERDSGVKYKSYNTKGWSGIR